ncbi:uncharacterized protein LY89DRAFT_415240 [Mollisia scopiformis]|uniref:Uncharacterized protein n=1 Tax=Mollisia scopiformis TaxID=149040 RepID=A0A132B1G8_MOLSC|nr:uncharacterized protein LY89DRAFT_415240 [Mollisia scopiformis]KUJ06225.1 hypothetical protein LY89DRAFT_415240 [Mollisia scopiformis]
MSWWPFASAPWKWKRSSPSPPRKRKTSLAEGSDIENPDTIVVDVGDSDDSAEPEEEPGVVAQSIVPPHLRWIIDEHDFADEKKTSINDILGDDVVFRQHPRGDRIQTRLNQRRAYHVGTMLKHFYRLSDQVGARERESTHHSLEPASYEGFLSSEISATRVRIDTAQFILKRARLYREELKRARQQLKQEEV